MSNKHRTKISGRKRTAADLNLIDEGDFHPSALPSAFQHVKKRLRTIIPSRAPTRPQKQQQPSQSASRIHLFDLPREIRDAIYTWHIHLISAAAIPHPHHGPILHTTPLTTHSSRHMTNMPELSRLNLAPRLTSHQLSAEYAAAHARRARTTTYLWTYQSPPITELVLPGATFLLVPPTLTTPPPNPFARPHLAKPLAMQLRHVELRFGFDVRAAAVGGNHLDRAAVPQTMMEMAARAVATVLGEARLESLTVTLCGRSGEGRGMEFAWIEALAPSRRMGYWDLDRFLGYRTRGVREVGGLRRMVNRVVVPHCAELPLWERVHEREGREGKWVEVGRCERDVGFWENERYPQFDTDELRLDTEWADRMKAASGHFPTTAEWERRREWFRERYERWVEEKKLREAEAAKEADVVDWAAEDSEDGEAESSEVESSVLESSEVESSEVESSEVESSVIEEFEDSEDSEWE